MLGGCLPDVIVFTETWLHPDQLAPGIAGYTAFTFSRPAQLGARVQGGIAVYVRESLAGRVHVWHVCPQASFAVLRFSGVLSSGRDLMLVPCYIPPTTSRHYDREVWDEIRRWVGEPYAVGDPLVVGDLNARTGDRPDFPAEASWMDASIESLSFGGSVPVSTLRCSQDASGSVNASGRRVLELCMCLGLRIANGRVHGDEHGALTFVARGGGGTSLIDYVLASPAVMPLMRLLRISPAPETDHLAVHMQLEGLPLASPQQTRLTMPAQPPRMMGDDRLSQWVELLADQICSDQLTSLIAAARTATEQQSLLAVCGSFDALISETWAQTDSDSNSRQPARHTHHRPRDQSARWFTAELACMRRDACRAMHRDSRSEEALRLRRAYQRILRRTRRAFIRQRCLTLATQLRKEPRKFWRSFSARDRSAPPIDIQHMTAHFHQLLSESRPAVVVDVGNLTAALPHRSVDTFSLDSPFTAAEVSAGVDHLQRCKASVGLLSLDALRAGSDMLSGCVAALFNACVRVGRLPPAWALCRITPIHKGGDATVAGNYRGIAVSTVLAKLYASLLTRRLSEWSERHHLRAVGQAGFRADHSTLDQMLVLRTLIESARAVREPLFACFVDFQKAYDSVPRDLLWQKLQRLGVTGWCLQAIQALYADVPLVVQGAPADELPFHSLMGVKQGCPLSPLLFGIYIDDLESMFADRNADLDLPRLGGQPVPPLFYADDLALVARSQAGLQSQMNLLQGYSEKWQLTVNVAKTRAIVFQVTRSAAAQLELTYRGSSVEAVDSFCYLGTVFHCTAPFSDAGLVRAATGQRSALAMSRRCRELGIQDPVMRMRLFDVLVRPVMLYR